MLAGQASAEHRKRLHRAHQYDRFYAGPEYVRAPRALRFIFGGYGGYEMTPEEYDQLFGQDDGFDESFYDPQNDLQDQKAKTKKKTTTKTSKKSVVPKPVAKPVLPGKEVETASVSAPAVKEQDASTDSGKSLSSTTASSSKGISCDKAGQIISGYGFTGVKPATCAGQVYAFNATRDGKNFAIKLNAANGELTEVKKLQ
jgi:hypothetical protein